MRQCLHLLSSATFLVVVLNAASARATDAGALTMEGQQDVGVGSASLPTAGVVVAGEVDIVRARDAVTINQSSARGIIDWGSFAISTGASVRFENGKGATLNRVTGISASTIDGSLSATGSVYLLNPNGVIVGRGGVVEVGGAFVASTLALDNRAFLAGGDLTLMGNSNAAVIHLGRLSALGGDVALVARTVRSEGSISAPNGSLGLLAGSGVLLRDAALNGGKFAVLVGGTATSATNTGTIEGAIVELRANGGDVYALAGSTGGLIRATGVSQQEGRIFLVADGGNTVVAGRLDAQRGDGGAGFVETSGATVALEGARVDAHGGTWLIDPTDLTIDQNAAVSISATLDAGTNVIERTTAGAASGTGAQSPGLGDITVSAPVGWSGGATLTLDAYHGIAVNAPITPSGAGGVELTYNNGGSGGDLLFGPASSIDFTGTPGSGQRLTINGNAYNLLYTMEDIAALNTTTNFSALARNLTAQGYVRAVVGSYGGTFEGLGHTVFNLTIDTGQTPIPVEATDSGNPTGLFGTVAAGATVRDLRLSGGSIRGGDLAGALAGHNLGSIVNVSSTSRVFGNNDVGALVGRNDGILIRATAIGDVSGNIQVGGLVGYNTGAITSATVTGSVQGTTSVGGVAGASRGSIAGAHTTATALVSGTSYVGGLVGYNVGAIGAIGATASIASGNVAGAYYLGGLAGINAAGGTIGLGSSATGSVVGTDIVGGLVGENDGTVTGATATGRIDGQTLIGGLAGGNDGSIATSTASGTVVGTGAYIGGVVGSNGGTILNSNGLQTGNSAVRGPTFVGGLVGGNFNPGRGRISGGGATGGVSGLDAIGGLAGINTASISNATAAGNASGRTEVGGLIGYNTGTIEQSTASGAASGVDGVGGLVGASTGSIEGSAATSLASAAGRSYVGGLVGYNTGTIGTSLITASGAAASVAGTAYVGGAVGFNTSRGIVGATGAPATYATGAVTGTEEVGGFAGGSDGVIVGAIASGAVDGSTNTGGLTGINNGLIRSATASGAVTAVGNVAGGLVGANNGTVADSFASGAVIGGSTVGGLAGSNYGTITTSRSSGGVTAVSYVRFYATTGAGGLIGFNAGAVSGSQALQTGATLINGGFGYSTGGLVGVNTGTIANSVASGQVISQGNSVGGLVGTNFTSVSRSSASGSVSSISNSVGGLIGYNYGAVAESSASGSVGGGGSSTGGLIGTNAGSVLSSMVSSNVTGTLSVGGLVGNNAGQISASQVTAASTVRGNSYVGGLVGYTYSSSIRTSYSAASVIGSGNYVGGLAGYADQVLIEGSLAQGSVTGAGYVGGLVGLNNGSVLNSQADGAVTGTGRYVGGLVGYNYYSGTVANAIATGAVRGVEAATTGGLVGTNLYGAVFTSYAIGTVGTGVGLVGTNMGTLTNLYWDVGTTGQAVGVYSQQGTVSNVTGIAGGTDRDPTRQSTYAGFDFTSIWQIGKRADGRPSLRAVDAITTR